MFAFGFMTAPPVCDYTTQNVTVFLSVQTANQILLFLYWIV